MKKLIITSLALATMVLGLQNAGADTDKNNQATQQQVQARSAWLGIELDSVPEVLSRQLGDVIPSRQGVMVQSVSSGSPAQKAGIKAFDIILSYGDHKIYSVEQLVNLVASDDANKKVIIELVSNGIKKELNVTLGSRNLATAPVNKNPMFGYNHRRMWPNFPRGMPDFKMPSPSEPSEKSHVMEQFESVRIQTLGDDRYRAEVDYQEYGEEKKQFVFEGKYDEVIEQIKNNKELPESKKNSLLNALKNNPDWQIPDDFSEFFQMPPMPSFDRYFDNAPSWYRNGQKL